MRTDFHVGQQLHYQTHIGVLSFLGPHYLVLSIPPKYSHLNSAHLLVYTSEWSDVRILPS